MEITRHFTATAYVVYSGKVLLHKHKKLGIWIAFGGHIDRDELPEETAVREVKEETELDITLVQLDTATLRTDEQATPWVNMLNRPAHLLLEYITDSHQHIDSIFYARAASDAVTLEPGIAEYRWFTVEQLDAAVELQENVRMFGKEAIEKCRMQN